MELQIGQHMTCFKKKYLNNFPQHRFGNSGAEVLKFELQEL
jgi:hypothetical protein